MRFHLNILSYPLDTFKPYDCDAFEFLRYFYIFKKVLDLQEINELNRYYLVSESC